VVGNEQDYHFEVLFHILKKLNKPYSNGNFHLSYGMVDLPSGKMKSREGTVVDADDLMAEMIQTAKDRTLELGKIDGFTEAESNELFHNLGLGALKYFLLKVEPKKRMLFNPEESIDFQGNTGPFIQYTHARIRSVIRNAQTTNFEFKSGLVLLSSFEKNLLKLLYSYPLVIEDAGQEMSPGVICNYVYDIAKAYNQFYHEHSILKEENAEQRNFRLSLCLFTGNILKHACSLLGIGVPEKM
jgi:arginyl-tRNA synthetase